MKDLNIQQFLDQDQKKDLLRLLTAGSVDDGKSTLIGRLLFDSKKLYEDQLDALERDSKREGHAGEDIDYALLLDGLKAEREQGITIDVAYRYFATSKRKFIIADTPGHEQYTRNMITGGSTASLAILLVDARKGVITQTRRHTFLASLLGIKHVILAVNKMDLMEYSEEVYSRICDDYKAFTTQLSIPDITLIPVSALKGDNVVEKSHNMPWYNGKSLLEHLETMHVSSDRNFEDFRFPVQVVNRPDIHFRGFAGTVASGVVHRGDTVMALPSGKTSTINRIIGSNGDQDYAFPPQAITLTLNDEIDISRGEMIIHPDNMPRIERHFEANLVWMDENKMDLRTSFYLKHNTRVTKARIDAIRHKVNINTLEKITADPFQLNEIGRVVITTATPLFFDPYSRNHQNGAFILIDPVTHFTCAVGMIIDKLDSTVLPSRITDIDKEKIGNGVSLILQTERREKYGQRGITLWITGLHGSGKNNLAYQLERELFDRGKIVVLLDGSTIRSGLSRELDHSPADRAEHLRRVAHMARILNDQGIITLCSFISPRENIRDQVAEIIGKERFHIIYMDADVEQGRKARPELYQLADEGKIDDLPGIHSQYEIPKHPDLVCRPDEDGENRKKIITFLEKQGII
ncbi:MAG: sulfate adenylyltransferase subunit CysN [Bacteroidales bacterium]|nr:sulfate adenylyltransferase subunit CysN [Bacteroidales bacterium]MDY0284724.1 sulfate adenylyltransferase subunit CysN [Bacteroidales bacterium]